MILTLQDFRKIAHQKVPVLWMRRGVFIFLSGLASDKYDIVQPDHDKEKGAAQGRLPEPEAKQHTNKCQPIQILLSVPKRVCNTN